MDGIVIDGKTKLLGLLGNPVEHSVSPALHAALARLRMDNYAYLAFKVEEDRLKEAVDGAFALGAKGLNVTVPYKKAVMPYLCEVDDKAALLGAVNTLVRTERGFKGYNTDMPGLYRAMKYDGVDLTGHPVVVIGAGGVSNAVLGMLYEAKVPQILVLNRTKEKADLLAERFKTAYGSDITKIRTASYDEDYLAVMAEIEREILNKNPGNPVSLEGTDGMAKWIAIQATSVGMSPDTGAAAIEDPAFYQKAEVGYDLIFNPAETKFMKLVKQASGRSYNGLRMLLFQGIYAYELWNDISIPDEWAGEVLNKLEELI